MFRIRPTLVAAGIGLALISAGGLALAQQSQSTPTPVALTAPSVRPPRRAPAANAEVLPERRSVRWRGSGAGASPRIADHWFARRS